MRNNKNLIKITIWVVVSEKCLFEVFNQQMSEFFDPSTALLCDESKDLCFDDLDDDQTNDVYQVGSEPLIQLPEQSHDAVVTLLNRELEYLPKQDYLHRLRSGDLDLSYRNQAFDWIFKAHSYHSFGPLSFCLAVNYLDRFFSIRELPRDQAWTVQLVAVACLSIAAKIEETSVPQSIELQVGDPKYVFEPKTIQRMELVVLDTLKWKMNAVTPCSLLDYSLKQLSKTDNLIDKFVFSTSKVLNRSMELILGTIRGIDYLEFRPSEIAAAVAMSVSAEFQAVDIDRASSCLIHLEKGRILKCINLIKNMMSLKLRDESSSIGRIDGVPQSPIGVLDAECFSYRTDQLTSLAGSCSNSYPTTTATATATTSPQTKRLKLDPASTL